jgi:hypothetical protein
MPYVTNKTHEVDFRLTACSVKEADVPQEIRQIWRGLDEKFFENGIKQIKTLPVPRCYLRLRSTTVSNVDSEELQWGVEADASL